MNTSPCVLSAGLYKGHRFPTEIISHCVWLYFRFCLSYRDVEEMMAERGIAVILSVSKYVDRNSGFLHSATTSLRGACMSAQFIDQTRKFYL